MASIDQWRNNQCNIVLHDWPMWQCPRATYRPAQRSKCWRGSLSGVTAAYDIWRRQALAAAYSRPGNIIRYRHYGVTASIVNITTAIPTTVCIGYDGDFVA